MAKLLGHYAWSALVRREALAVRSAVYGFMDVAGEREVALLPSVRRELRWMAALVQLFSIERRR
eukprot:8609449-Lingulodinium_polyedra.AAC.1